MTKLRKFTPLLVSAMAVGLLLLVTACTKDFEADERAAEDRGQAAVAVGFDAQANKVKQTRSGATGAIDTERLKEAGVGFGVMAVFTGKETWQERRDNSTLGEPNFMWNQKVSWQESMNPQTTSYVTGWVYDPVKYWPNENDPADDQDNDTGNNPAQGVGDNGGKVSFFAYAPFVQNPVEDTSRGITYITSNETGTNDQYLTYKLAENKYSQSQNVDLLWSYQPDLNKMKSTGEGRTTGTVKLPFIHALSRFTVQVQGVFDRAEPGDDWIEYPDEVDGSTKIFVESVTILSPQVYTQGNMYLTPVDADPTHPRWDFTGAKTSIDISGSDELNSELEWAGMPDNKETPEDAETVFMNTLKEGVTSVPKTLLNTTASADDEYRLVLPTPKDEAAPLKVRVVYYVVTYDPRLTLNQPRYFSIVKNDIEATATSTFRFDINKTYTLRLLLGLTTVKFSVDVDEWGVPIIFDGEVRPWAEETKEYNVE